MSKKKLTKPKKPAKRATLKIDAPDDSVFATHAATLELIYRECTKGLNFSSGKCPVNADRLKEIFLQGVYAGAKIGGDVALASLAQLAKVKKK